MHAALSKPLSELSPSYDVVIIGSGYGGSVMAARLAQAGRSVCVLERGRELRPGDFPTTSAEAATELNLTTPAGQVGRTSALFRVHADADITVLTGCGLGGGSLINGGVLMRPDRDVFDDPRWPAALRADVPGLLEESYARAEEVLGAKPFPKSDPRPRKIEALERAASAVNLAVEHPPLTIAFETGVNRFGVRQQGCTGCGECCSGCNVGAKNTLMTNYLADAVRHGAVIVTETDVLRVERADGRWTVTFDALGRGRDRFDAEPMFVTADVVVLAAGTLGSTEILLRSKQAGLSCSARVGERFSGNGNVLAFATDTPNDVHARGRPRPTEEAAPGPAIIGLVRVPGDPRAVRPSFVVEDGAHPSLASGAMRMLLPLLKGSQQQLRLHDLAGLVGPAGLADGHARTMNWLVMADDPATGRLRLDDGKLRVDAPRVEGNDDRDRTTTEDIRRTLGPMSAAIGGRLVSTGRRSTVHPLGGCAMAERAELGVVDHAGRVFAGEKGTALHDGLYVVDASTVPCALRCNPIWTLSALAERAATLMIEDRAWSGTRARDRGTIAPQQGPRRPLRFSERMTGELAIGEAGARGEVEIVFSIELSDAAAQWSSAEVSRLHGSARIPALSDAPLLLTQGTFRMLGNSGGIEGRRMAYRGVLAARDGRRWFFDGHKDLSPLSGGFFEGWKHSTHLRVVLREGENASGPIVGRGVLKIRLVDFARMISTASAPNEPHVGKRALSTLSAMAVWYDYFLGRMVDLYTPVIPTDHVYSPTMAPPPSHRGRGPLPMIHAVRTEDGVELRLTRHRGGSRGPVLLAPGYSMSTRVFTLDTLETSLMEHLTEQGYDVFMLDWRSSPDLESSTRPFTLDDVARYDYPAAVSEVLRISGHSQLDVVAHCVGSQTFLMSLLRGELAGRVRSAVCLQLGAHQTGGLLLNAKVRSGLPTLLDNLGLSSINCAPNTRDGIAYRLLDAALHLYPVAERCDNGACRRSAFLFGDLTHHDNVSAETHRRYGEILGHAAVRPFRQMARITRRGHVVDFDGADAYMPNLARLALPITFIHGGENRVATQGATARTYDALCNANGAALYRRYVVDGYGHLDCLVGQRAHLDVYPLIDAGLALSASAPQPSTQWAPAQR